MNQSLHRSWASLPASPPVHHLRDEMFNTDNGDEVSIEVNCTLMLNVELRRIVLYGPALPLKPFPLQTLPITAQESYSPCACCAFSFFALFFLLAVQAEMTKPLSLRTATLPA